MQQAVRKVQPVAFLFTYNAGSFEALTKQGSRKNIREPLL